MPFNRVIESLDIISKLADLPNEDDNLTADELKAKFDKGVNILKEYVFSFIDELEGVQAANKIGYDGAHPTLGEAVKALEAAGVGTVPPDNTITSEKLQAGAVTEEKLAPEIISQINAKEIKFGSITPTYTGSTTTDNGTSTYVTADKWQEFDIGFTPSVVFLFKVGSIAAKGAFLNSTGSVSLFPYGIAMGEKNKYDSRGARYFQYGGLATKDLTCMCNNMHEVFKIEGSKIKTHLYKYENTDNINVDLYELGTKETLHYIAIA